jgi:hypothetical protein
MLFPGNTGSVYACTIHMKQQQVSTEHMVTSSTAIKMVAFRDFASCDPVKTDRLSVVLTASVIRATSKPRAENLC